MQLITVANAYITTAYRLGAFEREMEEVQELIAEINNQQSPELKAIE